MNVVREVYSSPGGLPESPPCPFCEGTETELVNPFGSQLSVSTYWCRLCRSPFEIMKWRGSGPGTEAANGPAGGPGTEAASGE